MEEQGELFVSDGSQTVCVVADSRRLYGEVTELLRAHAIRRLLVDADPEGFSSDLTTSGRAALAYMRQHARPAHADRRRAHSCAGSFFDALTAGDIGLASELADLAPPQWRPDREGEEDFLWQRTLGLILIGAPKPIIEAHLTRFVARVADAGDARLEVCRALYAADAAAFEQAFRSASCVDARSRSSEAAGARRRTPTTHSARSSTSRGSRS